jgi:large repetitive protein
MKNMIEKNKNKSIQMKKSYGGIKVFSVLLFTLLSMIIHSDIISQSPVTITSSKVTMNYEGNKPRVWGSDQVFTLERINGARTRAFLEFNLSAIPSGATITSASLRLVHSNSNSCDGFGGGGGSFTTNIQRVTRTWVEGSVCNTNQTGSLSWTSAGSTNWTTEGGDYTGSYGSFTGGHGDAEGTIYSINVTTLVNEWYNGTYSNFGFALVPQGSDPDDYYNLYSDDAASSNNRPQLIVEYTFPAPSLSTSVTNINCNGANNGAINLTVTGGNPPFTYAWSNGASTEDISLLAPGTYTVTVTNTGGGSSTTSASVTQPSAVSGTINSQTNVLCFGQSTGAVTVTGSGGTGSYTYRLNSGSFSATNSFTGLAAGPHTVTVRDANLCTSVVNINITTLPILSAPVFKSNVTCFGQNNGNIALGPADGGSGSYQYRLNIGSWQSSNSFMGLAPGSYLVQIRDANNLSCERSLGVQEVTQPPALSAIGLTSNVLCNGGNNGSINQTVSGGTGAYTYIWSDAGPATKDRTMLTAGLYSVTISDANSCNIVRSYNITQPMALTIAETVTQPECGVDGSIVINISGGTGPYNFDWADIGGTNNPQNRSNLLAGNYSLTVTDQNGCTVNEAYNLINPSCGPGTPVCINGNNAAVYSIPPDPFVETYNWTVSNGGQIVSGQGTPQIVVNWTLATAGEGQVCVNAENACGESIQTCENILLKLVDPFASANDVCAGGTIQLLASGGTEYLWSGPGGYNSTNQNPQIFNASSLNNGKYLVTVTDADGCSAKDSVTLSIAAGFTLDAFVSPSACGLDIGYIDVTINGGAAPYDFLWSNGATTQNIENLGGGNYTISVTDNEGCVATISGSVPDFDGPSVTANATNVTCNGGLNGSVTANATGGTGILNYTWSTGATTVGISGVKAGLYSVVVVDSFGCIGAANAFVNQPNPIQVNILRTNLLCNGVSTGAITLTVNGGTPGYTYNWSDIGIGTANRTGLAAGPYSVTITDAATCSTIRNINITQPSLITGSTVVDSVLCFGQSNGVITLNISGGTSPYTYAWTGPGGFVASTKDISDLAAGMYSVTVTDANNCQAIFGGTVGSPTAIVLSLIQDDPDCFGESSGSIDLSASGGNGGFVYQWSNGATTQDIGGIGTTTYTVLVTDRKGCTQTEEAVISQPELVEIAVSVDDVDCFGANTGSISLNVTGGVGPYTYAWSDAGPNQSSRMNLVAGNYTVTVTDDNNCTTTQLVTINQSAEIEIIGIVKNVSCNGGSDGGISLSVNGGVGNYTYAWSNGLPAQDTQNGLSVGTYSVTVTDQLGCSQIESFNVTQPSILDVSGVASDANCFQSADGEIDITVVGGTGPYTYAWSNGSATQDVNGLVAGNYSVTVTDLNQCTAIETFEITEPSVLTMTSDITPNCLNQNNGSVTLNVSGGTLGYSYSWSGGGSGTNPRTLMGAGLYYVTVTDANLCTIVDSFDLIPMMIEVTGTDRTCALINGSASAGVSGGLQPYSYLWSNGSTEEFIQGLEVGTYSVTVTSGGCVQSGSINIGIPNNCDPPVAVNDFYSAPINTPINGTVMPILDTEPGYDFDPFYVLDSLTFEDLEPLDSLIGTIVWDERGNFEFMPTNGFIGSFTLDYLLCNQLDLCDTATLHITVQGNPSWTITKTSITNPNNYDQVGDILTYQIALENTGNVDISMVTVSDPQATTGPTYQSGDVGNNNILSPGEIWIYSATYTVTQGDLDRGSFTNIATATGTPPAGTILDDVSDDELVPGIQNPGIQLVKTSTTVPNRYSYVGDVLTYNLAVTNTGNVTLVNVAVSDPQATVVGSPIASIAPGQTVIRTASYIVTQPDLDAEEFINIATAIGKYTNSNGDTLTVSDSDDEMIPALIPDVTPVITAVPNVMQGVTEFNLTIRVTELNHVATNGAIIVRIPKDVRLSLKNGFEQGLTQLGAITLMNNQWSYSQDASFHIFTTNTSISAGMFSTFGFIAIFDPGSTKGVYTVTSQIDGGSGGEIRINNNVDSEKIDYFIE